MRLDEKKSGKLNYIDNIMLGLTGIRSGRAMIRYAWWGFILILIALIGLLVYFTGGTPNTIAHLMYIPIIISVFIFGVKGGIFSSLVSGLVLGPYMPVKISDGSEQETFSWMLRILLFIIIVIVVGQLTEYIRRVNDVEKKKAYEDSLTGRPSLNKFKYDMENHFKGNKQDAFSVLMFEFENMEMVNRYVSYEVAQKSLLKLLDEAEAFFDQGYLYSLDSNKFIVLLADAEYKAAYDLAKGFIKKMKKPVYVKELPVAIITRGSLAGVPLHGSEPDDIIMKLEKALDEATKSHHEIMIYDEKITMESRDSYNTLISLYRAVQNDTFTLVYQPKIRPMDCEMVGVEALLRWNDNSYRNLPISDVIKIAEDAEFISQITRWVIDHSILQLKEWEKEGIRTTIAINLSPRDLKDTSILEYTRECIEAHNVDPGLLEFELTERTIIDDEITLFHNLNEIRKAGIKVSLDDYGTGHNSLKYISKIFFHFDYIKIDKQLIDEIDTNKILIEAIIKVSHGFGIKVIAEGVETKEQLDILHEAGCDYVQGYYFSKPLPPERFVEYAKERKA